MNEYKTQQTQNRKRLILVGFIVAMVLLNILLIYLILQNKNAEIAQREAMMAEQKEYYEKNLKDLSEKLEDQIKEAKRVDSENRILIDSLQQTLTSIQTDRENLRNTLRFNQEQAKEFKMKIQAYEILLRKKDEEIERLRGVNETLHGENIILKKDKNELNATLNDSNREKSKLTDKLNEASVLKAENIVVNIINDRGKEESGGMYRSNRIDKLSVRFTIGENKFAKIGNKEIYMRIVEPGGTVLANPGNYGKFVANGQEMIYTSRQQILFDNSRQSINFQFAKSNEFQPGRHSVELFSDGLRIGLGSFEVR